jgi:hypothetical protein
MERLGNDAARLMAAAGAPRVEQLAAIVAAWPGAVGETVARNAWPQRVARDGTLQVATTSATWSFELGRLSADVLERLRTTLGDDAPVALRFAPGPVPEASAPTTAVAREIPCADPGQRRAAAAAASVIEDDELRELVARAAAASLALAADDQRVW